MTKPPASKKAPRLKVKVKPKVRGKANRQVKSYMFSTLFSDVESIIDLVNALLGTDYAADTPAEIATLENVLSSGPLNDLAIILNDTLLVLVEHQSTVNPNMAYRMLEYVVEIYKRRTASEDLYSTVLVKLPRPVFVVLYNGTRKLPAREIQRLSSAFSKALPAFSGLGGLELEVTVINMNDPGNKGTIKACKLLSEYSIFVKRLFRYRTLTSSATEALNKAVDACIAQGVLKDFLKKHRKELLMGTMLVKEWDWDMALKVSNRENFEKGVEKGMEKGMEKGIGLGVKKGIGLGVKKGVEAERAMIAGLIKRGATVNSIKKALLKQETPKRKRA
jgi:hypothetical protein